METQQIAYKDKNVKTITITIPIWKQIAQIKIDKGLRSYNEVFKLLLEK